MQKIRPCLWFDDRIEDAVNFYVGLFKGKHLDAARYSDQGPQPAGKVMVMNFEIQGQEIMALNGGPQFQFNEAVSFVVPCKDQTEVDFYWDALTANGGAESMCGWLKDRFGLSWQVVPDQLGALMGGADRARANRVMGALLKMRRIIIADLEAAAAAS